MDQGSGIPKGYEKYEGGNENDMEDGWVLFETDNGIELEYDMLGNQG